ncbi:PREDICTED: mitogen-activated protein kinase kinase kinase YODA-like [Fragaria vesca subsp. vesca]|uniref:mitogen-activated protein kinase kinase kinase YODA-like n=1 Tax=Fragaria vesca subsp. vesca TaxID=101020 RepID=UPI0002C3001B|nr:PREDICTED: mitogen-activated protein kinase kinase kinase YODA-like [Fragaria vesca subsp. vesca]
MTHFDILGGGLLTISTDGFDQNHTTAATTCHRLPLPNHLMPSSSSSPSPSQPKGPVSSSSSVPAQRPGIIRSGSDVNSPRRLTRQGRLSKDVISYSVPEKSRSSPTSPEYSTRKSRSPSAAESASTPSSRSSVGDSARKSCSSSSFVAGPQGSPHPLPLPEFPVTNRRPDCGSKDNNFFSRKRTDQAGTTSSSAKASKNYRQDVKGGDGVFYFNWLNVPSRTKTECAPQLSQRGHHPVSPQRAKTMDFLPTHSSYVAANNYNRGMGMRVSTEANFERESYNLSRSAPTSVFSSPAVSPRRSNVADPFPFFTPHQEKYQDGGATFPSLLLSPKKTTPTLSPNHSPLHSPTPRSPRFSPNASNYDTNSLATAHPLPLPPGAAVAPPPQSIVMHQNVAPNVAVTSMKGQWQKGKLIGRGTFGSVYLATNRETGALCAMKEVDLIPDDPKSAESIKQLEQEIKVLRTLKHPNIVQYYGSEVIDDHFYIYLEYVHPGSINRYVQDHFGAMTESVVRNFTRHILYGLAYLHDTKTIHRDIKGANLLVDASGVVKLADFGMAKHLSAHSYNLSLKGSPYWMAPEVIKAVIQNDGDPNLALAVDIWSLGCTIIEMFNGKPPWSEFEGPQAMFKVLHRTPDIPERLSAEGKEFLSLCFKRNPAERPSAKKLLDHPFVRISNDQNVSSYSRAFSLVNLMDKLNSPTDHIKQKLGRVLVGSRTSN